MITVEETNVIKVVVLCAEDEVVHQADGEDEENEMAGGNEGDDDGSWGAASVQPNIELEFDQAKRTELAMHR